MEGKEEKTKLVHRVLLHLHILLLCLLIMIVWAALSLPVVFFNRPPEIAVPRIILIGSNFNCSTDAVAEELDSNDVCYKHLTEALLKQNCNLPKSGKLMVPNAEDIQQVLSGMELLSPSAECKNEVIPFLCLSLHGLCSESGFPIQPTYQQCVEIRDQACRKVWAEASSFNIELPDCAALPLSLQSCDLDEPHYDNMNASDNRKLILNANNSETDLICSDGFYWEDNSSSCLPSCHSWYQYSQEVTIAADVAVVFSAVLGFSVSVTAIALSCLCHKRMVKFPSILILYMLLDTATIAATLMVGYMDRNGLYCSSVSLFESIEKVAPFCVISGIVMEYASFQLCLWWALHVLMLLIQIVFPLHAISLNKSRNKKFLHGIFVTIGLTLPAVPILTSLVHSAVKFHETPSNLTTFASSGLGYGFTRFPPILCYERDREVLFYSFTLPIDIMVALGCSMLLTIVWFLHRRHIKMKITSSTSPMKISKAEIKLIVVFIYYIILSVFTLSVITLNTRNFDSLKNALLLYFSCEQGGYNMGCSRDDIEKLTHPFTSALSYVLLCLFPIVNLIYIVNIQECKDTLSQWKLNKFCNNVCGSFKRALKV